MREIFTVIQRVAKTDATVLIEGESGTGKELIARAVHSRQPRARRPVRGHQLRRHPRDPARERALRPREGRVHRRARRSARASSSWPSGGTLFLDEIGELPLDAPGRSSCASSRSARSSASAAGSRSRSTCASSPPPTATSRASSSAGRFREDLYYRLSRGARSTCRRCASAARTSPLLANHFLARAGRSSGARVRFGPQALQALDGASAGRATCASWRTG